MSSFYKVPLKIKRNGEWQTIGYTTANLLNSQISGIDTSDANATANDILLNKTAYVNGSKITGNIPSRTQSDITPGTSDITINSGYYGSSFKVKGDSNLIAGNIKSGATIFGVNGTYAGSSSTSISMDDHSPSFDRGCTELNQGFEWSSWVFSTGSETYNGSSWEGVGNSNTGSKVNEIKYCKITSGNTSRVGINTSFYKTQSYNYSYRYLFFKDATTLKADTNGICLDRYSDGTTDLIMPVLLFQSQANGDDTIKNTEVGNIRTAIVNSLNNPWNISCDEKVIYGFPKKAGNSRMFITYSDLPTGNYYVVFCFPCVDGISSDNNLPISLIQEFNFLSWNFHGATYTKTTHDASQG